MSTENVTSGQLPPEDHGRVEQVAAAAETPTLAPAPAPDPSTVPAIDDEWPPLPRAVPPAADRPTGPAPGHQAPPAPAGYEVLGELGRGGMGVVYRARQIKLNRLVALKMILAGAHAGEKELARFRSEAEAVAQMQHPNIVQIHEVGEHGGQPFFCLEFVDGGSLAEKLDGTPWPGRQASRLVEALARAMDYAHERGVIHRDLKPANVLLTADSAAKITDFGLAKQLGSQKGQTQTGAIMGTPSYMAPEQAGGHSHEIGPATDVYALGAILYELLTGRPPFRAETPLDTVLQVVSEEPVPPRRLHSKVPRDLDTICLKCLEKAPARRYASAGDLADELARFRNDEPIRARPIGPLGRGWRWCKRRPLVAGLSAAVALLLLFGAAAGPWLAQYRATLQARQREESLARERAEEKALVQERETRAAEERADRTAAQSIGLAHREWSFHNVKGAEELLDQCPDRFRGWEWNYLKGLCHGELLTLRGHNGPVAFAAFLGNGQAIGSVGTDGTARTWDALTGQPIQTLGLTVHGGVAFSPDGRFVVASPPTELKEIRVWDVRANREHMTLRGHTGVLVTSAFGADGRHLVSADADKVVKVWDVTTGECLRTLRGQPEIITGVALSPDGKTVITGDAEGTVKVWDATTGRETHTPHGHLRGQLMLINAIVFSPDGGRFATASSDGSARVWDTATGKEVLTLRGHIGNVHGVRFSPDGKRLATAGWDQTARTWDAETGQALLTFRGHTFNVFDVGFSPDGTRLVTASLDGTMKVWDATGGQEYRDLSGHQSGVQSVAFSPDGRLLASASWDKTVKVWDVAGHRELLTFRGHDQAVGAVAFSPDGKRVASASGGYFGSGPGKIKVWDPASGKELLTLPGHAVPISSLAFSPDGKRLVSATASQLNPANLAIGEIKVWDAAASTEVLSLKGHRGAVFRAVFSPDGARLASASLDGVRLWDATSGDCLRTLGGGALAYLSVAFSPDGRRLAAGGNDTVVHVWDADTGEELSLLRGHSTNVLGVTYSPDGKRLVSTGHDATIKIWDTATGLELLTLRGHAHEVYSAVFSPDGNLLASSSFDGSVKLWDGKVPALPETDDWKVLFADDFERPDLGDRWEAQTGRWSVEGGALRGELAKAPAVSSEWIAAVVRPRIDPLPSTAEVRFDCWSPDAVNCETYLHTEDGARGLIAVLMGSANQWVVNGPRGVSLALQSGKTLFQEIAFSQKVRMERNRHYRVRVLREPRRLTVFVDGVKVVSAPAERVPDLDLPNLRLQASLGQAGNAIYFDNVEVRAPLGAIQEQQARTLVARLFDQLLLRGDVIDHLRGDATLSEPIRKLALHMAETHPEDVKKLIEAAWHVVNEPGGSRAAYEKALQQAEAACRLAPDNWQYLDLLGTAQYRAGRYQEALKTLARSMELARADMGSAVPREYAFLAMSHHQLGQAAEARADFIRLRDLMKGTGWAGKDFARHVYREAEALLRDSLKEDEADREKEAIKDTVFKAVQAGWVNHDLKAHLSLFTDDARSISARAEEPGPADVVIDRKRIEALRPLQFRETAEGLTFSFEDARVDLTGDEAVLRCRSAGQWDDGFTTFDVTHRLRRTPQGWKAYEERGWMLKQKIGPRTITYDAGYYRERDAQVEKLRQQGDRRELARALAEARRPAEGHAVARELTAATGAPAADWALRGELAFRAGDVEGALASFRRALRIEPEVEVPRYMSRELRTFRGHARQVFGVAFNDDGTRLASGGDDQTVKVWDAATGKEIHTLRGHTQRISGVAYSPDGRRIASASLDHTVKVWDARTGQELRTLSGHTSQVYRVAFSPDGRRIVSASADRTARVWDAETSRLILTLSGHEKDVLGAVFSPDGLHVATASHDKKAKIWDANTGHEERTLEGHGEALIRVAYSPDGKRLASASADRTVKLWDAATGKELRTLSGHTALVEVVTFSPDGRSLASAGSDRTIKVSDADTGRRLLSLRGHGGRIFALAFSPDGKALASACEDGTVKTWDVTGLDELRGP